MIHKIWSHLLHWKIALLLLLNPLGFWGVGILAAIDASSLAIPMDLIIAGYVWSNRQQFWIYPVVGAIGAAVGALVPFYIGRTGGEWVLLKHVDASKYAQMRARFDRHRWFAVAVPAAMPPPFPFKLFAFGAGVFEMRVLPYMAAVFVGRTVHYMATALLVVYFGPEIVALIVHTVKQHAVLSLLLSGAVAAAFVVYTLHRRRRRRRQAEDTVPSV